MAGAPTLVGRLFADGVELRLDALLGLQQSVPVAGERAQLGEGRGGDGQRALVRVLVAQSVGQGEGVENVALAAGHPVALASPAAIRGLTGKTRCPPPAAARPAGPRSASRQIGRPVPT
jgi:hypothetical protein